MIFLRWLSGFVLLFWLLAIVFKIGGNIINLLLLFAAIIFVFDTLLGIKKST